MIEKTGCGTDGALHSTTQEVARGGLRRHQLGYGPRSTLHQAAVSLALPHNQEREVKLSYLEQYSCRPPPVFMLLVRMSE